MPRPNPHPAVLAAVLLIAAPARIDAAAQEEQPGTSLESIEKEAEQRREEARELESEAQQLHQQVQALKAESVAVAKRTQDLESELTRIEDTLATLEEERAAKGKRLAARRDQLAVTLSALQRIAVLPPEALAVAPSSPLEIVRSAKLLQVAVPEIEKRAARLKDEIEELQSLRAEIRQQQASLQETAERLAEERQRLNALLARKQELRQQTAARSRQATEQAEQLARQAADMRELMAKLQAQAEAREAARRQRLAEQMPRPGTKPPPPGSDRAQAEASGESRAEASRQQPRERQSARLSRPSDIRDFPGERSSLTMPARGRVVTRFGSQVQRAGGATRAKGIEIATRAGAQVVAPYDGQVVYAGPFRGYGRILIIEHGGRYHSLVAGLERIDAVVGQWVLAGEPVGTMGENRDRDPQLYLELRRAGQPINPLPWLAQTGDKVQG